MRLLKYFENFLNEEKLYKKLYSVVGYDDFIFIKYEVTGSFKKNLKDFDSLEIKQIKNLLYPKFNEPTPTDSKRLFFSEGDFSFEIFKDIDDYYYVRYAKNNSFQYFECDGKDGLMDFISDLKGGEFDHYFSRPMIWN